MSDATVGQKAAYLALGTGCNCTGPQNGQPKCPRMMRNVIERDGRWIEKERDLGAVRPVVPAYVGIPTNVLSQRGCVCPPGAEITCKGMVCPRRGIGGGL